jgi:hypothetical protein
MQQFFQKHLSATFSLYSFFFWFFYCFIVHQSTKSHPKVPISQRKKIKNAMFYFCQII